MSKRTDMAMDLVSEFKSKRLDSLIKRTDIVIDEQVSKKIGKPSGKYITIESPIVTDHRNDRYDRLIDALAEVIEEYSKGCKEILVIGLGNPNLTADALGSKVFDNLITTRQLDTVNAPKVCGFCPNVLGITGIESYDIIKAVTDRIKPEMVIIVDSLASAAVNRLARAFQICSSGITPGSGVSNHRQRLDKDSLGAKVISIGVPLVVYAGTIMSDALNNVKDKDEILAKADNDILDFIVTPKDIDILVDNCALIVAKAINKAMKVNF